MIDTWLRSMRLKMPNMEHGHWRHGPQSLHITGMSTVRWETILYSRHTHARICSLYTKTPGHTHTHIYIYTHIYLFMYVHTPTPKNREPDSEIHRAKHQARTSQPQLALKTLTPKTANPNLNSLPRLPTLSPKPLTLDPVRKRPASLSICCAAFRSPDSASFDAC